jgi:hypothetical protein
MATVFGGRHGLLHGVGEQDTAKAAPGETAVDCQSPDQSSRDWMMRQPLRHFGREIGGFKGSTAAAGASLGSALDCLFWHNAAHIRVLNLRPVGDNCGRTWAGSVGQQQRRV